VFSRSGGQALSVARLATYHTAGGRIRSAASRTKDNDGPTRWLVLSAREVVRPNTAAAVGFEILPRTSSRARADTAAAYPRTSADRCRGSVRRRRKR